LKRKETSPIFKSIEKITVLDIIDAAAKVGIKIGYDQASDL
jgi:hypothetical protein